MKKHTNSKTILISSIIPLMLLALVSVIASNTTVSALEYQTTADVSFTFRPFINVNLSGDLVINNLAPGSYADSNIITVGVSTNAGNGYVMQATAGTNTTNTRLVNTDNSNFYFSSLGTSDTVASMNSAGDNTWGFSYSDDDGTTWISAPGTLGYSGLPLDANTNADERGKGGKTLLDTDGTTGDQSIQFKIGAKAATTQAAGTYTNIINFYAVAYPEPEPVPTLYDNVASMSKGKQTAATLQAAITVPTSTDRTQDTSNSGVYEYDPSVFGTSSDASNNNKIYYYRGVLENSVGSYGSDGSAVTYPNYVKLGNTCWRIVRTTGSGGVKMIYNGLYGATTAGSCANTEDNAQVATSAFNGTLSDYQQIVRVGYTHNSTYATNTSQSGTIAQVFGSNSNPGANNTRSDIKTYIEDTWYTGTNGVSAYTNILEPSAGYCNDRTMNTTYNWTTPLAESTTIASTYGTYDLQTYYFGARQRTVSNAQPPSLACGNKYSQIDRSIVDLYRYNGTNGAAGSTTANYLKYPAALLTADEAALAGSGFSSSTTPYHSNSFLRSGSFFWLLSPSDRSSLGYAAEFSLSSNGILYINSVNGAIGVRPAISLTSGTTAASGSGTATDPWIVNPPSS